ncbi:MAG: ComEC/Rec2 family competence protein [Treponema sp.]|jgi:competence protein ComEC|nr:ComEC/Rec2 family competence protein [Treponema sp.]
MVNALTPLLCAAIGAAFGYYCFGNLPPARLLAIAVILIIILCFFRVLADVSRTSWKIILHKSAAFAAGICLGICAFNSGKNVLKFGILENNITALTGVLLEDPRLISGSAGNVRAMAVISLREAAGGGIRASSSGELTIFLPEDNALKIREFGRGTTIFAEGRLRADNSGGFGRTFSAESLHVVKQAPAIERIRTNTRLQRIQRVEGKSWGGLALAMLVGIRDNLDTDITALFRSAGLSYILALSGMHLAVITALIAFVLKKPLGLKAASIVGAVFILFYCFLVGPMPSLNRAALMYLLGVLAVFGALPKQSMSILALSFLIQIVITPAAGNTISFILSYLAMIGILVIAKAFISLFSGKIPGFLLQPLSISSGAFLATAGVCCYTFGYIAPAGIITGLVIVPATTVFMIGSILWLLLDMISLNAFSVSGILDLPLSLLYQLMEKTAFIGGLIPGIQTSKPFLVLLLSIVLSLSIIILDYRARIMRLRLKPFYD